MVDKLKDISQPFNGENLRKNLKNLSSSPENVQQLARDSSDSNSRLNGLNDSLNLSAESLRLISDSSSSNFSPQHAEVISENINSASSSPAELRRTQEQAQATGASIRFQSEEALAAHGEGLTADRVYRLLSD